MSNTKTSTVLSLVSQGFGIVELGGEDGKKPIEENWTSIEPDPLLDTPKGNYGVVLKPKHLIIDIDPRNFKDKIDSYQQLRKDFPELVPLLRKAPIVRTGSGGAHIYLIKPAGDRTKKKSNLYPGIDFLSEGCQAVGPFSVNFKTKKQYHVISGDFSHIPEAPQSLIEVLKSKNPERSSTAVEAMITDDQPTIDRAIHYLENDAPFANEGENGDDVTFKVACRIKDFGLSKELATDLMIDHWNEFCDPPWDMEELATKVDNAYAYGLNPIGAANPQADFKDVEIVKEDKPLPKTSVNWDIDHKGRLKPQLMNIVNLFRTDEHLWKTLIYNQFSCEIELSERAHVFSSSKIWSDSTAIAVKFYIASKHRVEFPTSIIHEGALIASGQQTYHPLKDKLESTKWDGTPRLDHWLTKYCYVIPSEYTRAVGRKVLVAAIERVYHPGCQFDYMMVLEGPQGIRKSSVCRILGGQWYADPKMDIQKKESIEVLKGKWIIEFAEMEAMSKADTSALKAYITRVSDRYRAAYGRVVEDYPRHCIFIGTINPQRSGYLKDSTGNRRYWPIQILKTVDTDALQNNVDQLWAEAYQVYLTREEPLYMKDSVLDTVAREEVEKRQIRDPWVDIVREFLDSKDIDGKRRDFVTIKDVYEGAMGGVVSRLNRMEHSRLLDALDILGWSEGYHQKVRGFRPTVEDIL